MKRFILLLMLTSFSILSQAQNVTGTVSDNNGDPIPGANVLVVETSQGAVSDFNGKFSLNIKEFPVTLKVSYIGYTTASLTVNQAKSIAVQLKENNVFLDDVVVTASRGKEKIKESPVSIERLSLKEIKRNTSPSFYDGLANLKGVDVNTNSLTFQSVNTRGFATFANNRFLQVLDGMDNTSPALNFPLGNLVGMNELDVKSVEILPGAASALYGANAFNGVLSMISKNPFTFKGLSAYVKYGQTKQHTVGTNPYSDVGVRYAWGGDYAAAKINFSFLQGTDWGADGTSDIDTDPFNSSLVGSRASNPSYDGMNIYGDEIVTTLPISTYTGGLLNDIRVSRTGYSEMDLTDNKAKSVKADVAFHYRPSGQPGKLEFIWNSRIGTGKTIYQGANRYVLDDIFIHQHKLEIKSKNFFVRAYYTGEDAGNTYDTKFTAWNINRKWRDDRAWFTDYTKIYIAGRTGMLTGTPMTEDEANATARNFADNSPVDADGNPKTPRYVPGTPEFKQAFEEVTNDPDFKTGGKFIDHSSVKHVEGNYNFKDLIKPVEIQVGGSLRRYSLHSEGTIFTDYKGLSPLHIDEQSAYVQLSKKLLDNKLKIGTSFRYDRQIGFDGNISPRLSVVYSAGEHKEHNFRFSLQKGFRNPSTQDLYIGLNLGPITLMGAAPDNMDRYTETLLNGNHIVGSDAYNNAYTLQSFMIFDQTHNPADLVIAKPKPITPERITTMEFGYRGQLMQKLGVDFVAYYNQYKDFGAGTRVMALASEVGSVNDATALNAITTGSFKPFQLYTNTDVPVTSYGVDMGLSYKIKNYRIGLIYDYAKFDFDQDKDPDFRADFNTPEHRIKFALGNDKIYKNFGFKIDYKYQTEFEWQSSFADGMVPARSLLDAQLSYNLKKYDTKIKVGATNLLGQEYLPAPGTGMVGSMYYISFTYSK